MDGEVDEQLTPATFNSLSLHNLSHEPIIQSFGGNIPAMGESKMAKTTIPLHDVYLIPRPPPPPLSLPIQHTHNVIFGKMISPHQQHNSGSFSHKIHNGHKGLREAHLAPPPESFTRLDVPGRETAILRAPHAEPEGLDPGTASRALPSLTSSSSSPGTGRPNRHYDPYSDNHSPRHQQQFTIPGRVCHITTEPPYVPTQHPYNQHRSTKSSIQGYHPQRYSSHPTTHLQIHNDTHDMTDHLQALSLTDPWITAGGSPTTSMVAAQPRPSHPDSTSSRVFHPHMGISSSTEPLAYSDSSTGRSHFMSSAPPSSRDIGPPAPGTSPSNGSLGGISPPCNGPGGHSPQGPL